jgi:predicted DNA-binding protein (MmcQ/YjbR family)
MTIEDLQLICHRHTGVTEDIKWGHDLCFSVSDKLFLIIGLDSTPVPCSFKVSNQEFEEITSQSGFSPAPYLGRYKWVRVDDINRMSVHEWELRIRDSYELIKAKLPAGLKKKLS